MEDEAADLDALAGRSVRLRAGVDEGGVGDAAGAAVGLAVEALDEEDLLRGEATLVVPAMGRGVAYGEGLALACGVDEADGHELFLTDAARVRDGQGVPLHRADRPPDVDDLHTAFEQLRRLLRR